MQHLLVLLPPETRVRVSEDDIPTLVIGEPSGFKIDFWTASHRGQSANADMWRRIAVAATELAQRCDDLATTAEVSA